MTVTRRTFLKTHATAMGASYVALTPSLVERGMVLNETDPKPFRDALQAAAFSHRPLESDFMPPVPSEKCDRKRRLGICGLTWQRCSSRFSLLR